VRVSNGFCYGIGFETLAFLCMRTSSFCWKRWARLGLRSKFKLMDWILFDELALEGHFWGFCLFVLYELFSFLFENVEMHVYSLCSLIVINCDFVFWSNMKNVFFCVAYGQYPNMFWIFFLYKKNIGSFENVFSHGFLKHNKNYFLAFLDFTTCL
jgi:hypothetical protein